MWKARRKLRLLLFMLVPQLRDVVPAVVHALNLFSWAVRRVLGQVHSYESAKRLNILPGSRTVDGRDTHLAQRDLILGLVLLEGSVPVSHLNPALHQFVHIVEFCRTHGLSDTMWMFGFERYHHPTTTSLTPPPFIPPQWSPPSGTHARRTNKHYKSLVKNPHHPDVSLAHSATRDAAARFICMQHAEVDHRAHLHHPHPRRPHECVLWGRQSPYFPSQDEIADLRLLGVTVDIFSVTEYPIAYILNVHFKAGEWGQRPRCGSVVTCVIDGRSLYARVNHFFTIDEDECPGYASVTWFGKPQYPLNTPMVVKVTGDGGGLGGDLGCIIRITQIDPSPIIVEAETTNDCYIMMRDSGYDTRPPPPSP